MLWKLRKLPYGITNAGSQWQKMVDSRMLEHAGFERVFAISQLFVRRDECGDIQLKVAKETDDFLLGGTIAEMRLFMEMLQKRFVVGKIIIDDKLHFDGCEIEHNKMGIITMVRYLERLNQIGLSRSRMKMRREVATDREVK